MNLNFIGGEGLEALKYENLMHGMRCESLETQDISKDYNSMDVQYSNGSSRDTPDTDKLKGSPFVKISILGRSVDAITDTGSERTICSAKQARRLFGPKYTELLQSADLVLRSATGHKLPVLGVLTMPMQIGESLIMHNCVVIDDDQLDFIIGNDLVIDRVTMKQGRTFEVNQSDNGIRSEVPIRYCKPVINIKLTESIVVQPRSVKTVNAQLCLKKEDIKQYIGHTFLVRSEGTEDDDVLLADAVAEINPSGYIKCCIGNPTDAPLELGQGMEVGQAELIFPDEKHPNHLCYANVPEYEDIITDEGEAAMNFVSCQGENDKQVLMGLTETDLPDPSGYEVPKGGIEEKPVDYDGLILSEITADEREQVIRVLRRYDKVFSKSAGDFGDTPYLQFKVDTGTAAPFHDRYRPIPIHYEREVREIIDMMLKTGVIEPCESPWVSNVILVAKPGRRLRVCINLRGVNKVTTNISRFPIMHAAESVGKLVDAKFFFQFDLSQAYYAIRLDSIESRQRTAFQVLGRQYRFIRGCFGLSGLPSAYNYLMSKIFNGCQDFAFFFFDDVIGIAKTFPEYIERLEICLKRVLDANLRINWNKSRFCLTRLDQISWLGMIIFNGQVFPDPKKVQAILDIAIPKSTKGVQKFLGMAGYLRKHLPHLARAAVPLHNITHGRRFFQLGRKELESFEAVRKLLMSAEALEIADSRKEFFPYC